MKKRICSILMAGMLGVCALFSAFVPAVEVSAHEAAAHSDCEHNFPPEVNKISQGYSYDSSGHWMQYIIVVKCKTCNLVLETIQGSDEKQPHSINTDTRKCKICGY